MSEGMTPERRAKLLQYCIEFPEGYPPCVRELLAEIDMLTTMNANLSKAATMAVDELDERDKEIDRLNKVVDEFVVFADERHQCSIHGDRSLFPMIETAERRGFTLVVAELQRRGK